MIRVTSERDGSDRDGVDSKTTDISTSLLGAFGAPDRQGVSTEAAAPIIAERRLTK